MNKMKTNILEPDSFGDASGFLFYKDTNYSTAAIDHKREIIAEFLDEINLEIVWDLGGNDRFFSRIASNKKIMTISFDIGSAIVQKNYLESVKKNEENILPLLLDLTNPSTGIGWENIERSSLTGRGPVKMAFALASVHHLAISNNLPIKEIVNFFSLVCKSLIIEFVHKDDSQV